MPRRVGLPGASELFRSTTAELNEAADAHRAAHRTAEHRAPAPRRRTDRPADAQAHDELRAAAAAPVPAAPAPEADKPARRRRRTADAGPVEHTGRIRHDEKITVYVSSEELLALERLRLELRAEHGLAVDRGRIVRAAIASALAAIEAEGEAADVLRRLAADS